MEAVLSPNVQFWSFTSYDAVLSYYLVVYCSDFTVSLSFKPSFEPQNHWTFSYFPDLKLRLLTKINAS